MPSLSVLLQHGDEAIVARIKGGSSLLKDYPDSFKSCAFIGNLNEVANVEMQKRTVKRQVNNTLSWHKSYVSNLYPTVMLCYSCPCICI